MTSLEQITINRDLLSGEIEVILGGIESLEEMLRSDTADASSIEPLMSLILTIYGESRNKASWRHREISSEQGHPRGAGRSVDRTIIDPDAEVRENISWTIGELTSSGIGKQEAIGPLNQLLSDKDRKVRGMAVWALGRMAERLGIAHPSSIPLVSMLVNDESMFVRTDQDGH